MLTPIAVLYVAMIVAFSGTSLHLGQSAVYFARYAKDDPPVLKICVGLLALADTVHQIFLIQSVYFWSVLNGNDPLALNIIPAGIFGQAVMCGTIALIVQSLYAVKIARLSRNWLYAVPVAFLSVGQASLLATYLAKAGIAKTMVSLNDITDLAHALNSSTAATDLTIAGLMTFLLVRSKTGFHRTNTIIDRLLIYVFMSGAATSVTAILVIMLLALSPTTNIYFVFYFLIPKAYTNSYLLVLNSRRSLRELDTEESESWQESTGQGNRVAVARSQGTNSRSANGGVKIKMETFTEVDQDSRHGFIPEDKSSFKF